MYLLKGQGDPYPEHGPLPFWEEFQLAERFGWTFPAAQATPRKVRALFLMYGSVLDGVREQARRDAMPH